MTAALQSLMEEIHREVDLKIVREPELESEVTPCPRAERPRPPAVSYRWREKPRKRRGLLPKPRIRSNEITLGEFLKSEMARCGISRSTAYERLVWGKYPGVIVRRPRHPYVFVTVRELPEPVSNEPRPGEVPFKEFMAAEARRLEITQRAVEMRFWRGKYPDVTVRRVNQRVLFVRVNGGETTGPKGKF